MRAWFIFSWSYFFIGLRWNPSIQQLRIHPVPFLGLNVDLKGEREDLKKSAVHLAYFLTAAWFFTIAFLVGESYFRFFKS